MIDFNEEFTALRTLKRQVEESERLLAAARMWNDENEFKVKHILEKHFKFDVITIEPHLNVESASLVDDMTSKYFKLNIPNSPDIRYQIKTKRARNNFQSPHAARNYANKLAQKWLKVGIPGTTLYFSSYNVHDLGSVTSIKNVWSMSIMYEIPKP